MFSIQVWTHMELFGFKHYYPFPFRTLQFYLEFKSFSLCFAIQVSVTLSPASFDFILFGLVRRLVCRVRLWPNYLTAAASVVVCHLLSAPLDLTKMLVVVMMMPMVVVIMSLIMVIIDHEGCISENRTGTSWTRLGLTIKITEFFQLLSLICFWS